MIETIKKFFQKLIFTLWYFGDPPWDTNITPPEVRDFIKGHPAGRALELGCGTGTNAITLAKHGWQVIGVDFVAKAIRSAQKKARRANLEIDFRVADVTRLENIQGVFDLILDIGCYHSLSPEGMMAYRANVKRLLKTGGSFMLYAFFRDEESETGNGVVEADLQAFSSFLDLVNRTDGLERGARPSTWLTFRKEEG